MEYSLEFSKRLIEAAESLRESNCDEAARAVLYLSLLSSEISLKATLESAGFTVKELINRSHDLKGLIRDICSCFIKVKIAGKEIQKHASSICSETVDDQILNGTVGALLQAENQGASKYPNEVRYGDLVKYFPPLLMLNCAKKVNEWASSNYGRLYRK